MVEVHGAGPYGPSGIRKLASGLWLAGVHGSWWVLASLRSQHAGDVPHKPFKLLGLDYLKLWMLRPIAFCIDFSLSRGLRSLSAARWSSFSPDTEEPVQKLQTTGDYR